MEIQKLFVSLLLDAADYTDGLEDSQREATRWQKAQGAMFRAFQAAALAALAVVVAAVVSFASDSLREFQQFEKGISEVFTLLPGLSEDAMGQMQEDVLAFSKEAGRTTDEVLPALYQAISAGVPKENVFDFLAVASDAALGGVTDLETAVDGITSVTNAYGASVIDAATASDVMFTAVKLGKTDFEQLSSSLFNVIPTAASLGVRFEDVAAGLAALTAQGTPTSVATTQLRAAFVEASKAGSGLDKALRELSGKGFADLIADGKSSSEIFTDLRESMPEEDFRNLFSSVEAANAVLGLTNDTAAAIIESFGDVEDTLGATAEAAETMAQSMEHLEAQTEATTEALKIQAGEALNPLKRAWLETKLGVTDYLSEDLVLRQQLLKSSDALAEFGYEGTSLQKALGALGEGTVLWRNSLVDAEIMARRTNIAVGLLENGFQGSADELGRLVQQEETAIARSQEASEYYLAQAAAVEALAAAIELEAVEAQKALNNHLRQFTEVAGEASGAQAMLESEMGLTAETIAYVAEQEEIAAEAARLAAERTAELNRQSGSLFQTFSESDGPLGLYYQSLEDIADGATVLRVNQDSLNDTMVTAAANAGASASQLALLKVATGELTEEQAEAIIKQVALDQTLARLAEQYANGDATLGEYMSAAQAAVRDISAMTVEFDTQTGSVATDNQAIGELIGTMNAIPSEIRTHISITSDPIPNMPGGSTGPGPGGDTPQAFMTGGFTGFGANTDIAGYVHANELVIPADVLAGGVADMLAFAKDSLPSRFSLDTATAQTPVSTPTPTSGRAGGDTFVFNIDAPGGDADAIEKAVERAMARSGRRADARIRTR